MKFSSVILSSFLALCTTVNGKPVTDESVIADNTIAVNESINKINIDPLIPIDITTIPVQPIKQCPLALGNVIIQNLLCNIRNGKFYQKFNDYPECNYDYVCFIPDKDKYGLNCISIEDKKYCSADVSNISVCKLSDDSYNFNQCVKKADEYFTNFEYTSLITLPIIDIPPPNIPPPINIPPINIPELPISFKTIEPFEPSEKPLLPIKTGLISEPIPTTIPVPIVRPTTVPEVMDVPPSNNLIKRAFKTTVTKPTKNIKKPPMVEVDLPIRPIDLIRTDLRIESSITKIKPYKPTIIPVPTVRPTLVPMDNDAPMAKRAIETNDPVPTKTIEPNKIKMVKVDLPIRPIDLIRTDLRIEPTITKDKPYKPTTIPVPTVRPTLVPMDKNVPLVKNVPLPEEVISKIIKSAVVMPTRTIKRPNYTMIKFDPTLIQTDKLTKITKIFKTGLISEPTPTSIPIPTVRPPVVPMGNSDPQVDDIPPETTQSNESTSGSRIRMDSIGNVTIDGVFYMQTLNDTNVYTPNVYLGNGGDYPGFYEGDTSVKFYTAKENADIIIVVFYDGSQLNLLKKDITNI